MNVIDIRINISIDMWTQFVLLTLMLVSASPSCVNLSSCFLQRLFDFSYPEEKVYSIALNEDLTSLDNVVLGYGDFNNDLHADYVALNTNSNDLLIFFYSTDQDFNGQYIIQSTQTIVQGCKPVSTYMCTHLAIQTTLTRMVCWMSQFGDRTITQPIASILFCKQMWGSLATASPPQLTFKKQLSLFFLSLLRCWRPKQPS